MVYGGRDATLVLVFVSLALALPGLWAHIAEFDEYWQERARKAENATLEAYHPNPTEVTNHLNLNVDK